MATTDRASRRRPQTWSLLGEVKRRPSVYEVTAAKFNYHFRREPAPFEMDPKAAINVWYLTHREGSAFNVPDWEGFRDPAKLTYADYVTLQHDRETYLDGLIDHHEAADTVAGLDPAWVDTLRRIFVPLRFPLHVLQMTSLYVAQMAPSAFIINCSNFQAADEMRRIQRMAYTTRMLANAHGEDLALTATARDAWERGEAWQPLREALERMLGVHDWGEAFVVLDLVMKPLVDALVNHELADLASAHGDEFAALLLTEFQRDSARSRDWTAALVRYATTQDPAVEDVVEAWRAIWQPLGDRAVEGLAGLFETAPRPVSSVDVQANAQRYQRALLDACRG
jgi:toluene monooxygenase system protein E